MKTFGVSTNSCRISVPILFVIILSYFGHKWPSWLLSFVLNHGLGKFIELYAYLWLWSWCTMQGCFEVGILLRFAKREQIDTPHESTWKLQCFTPEFEGVGIPFIMFQCHTLKRWHHVCTDQIHSSCLSFNGDRPQPNGVGKYISWMADLGLNRCRILHPGFCWPSKILFQKILLMEEILHHLGCT